MQISARADYAIRALAELVAAGPGPVKSEHLAQAQHIPGKFLENILSELRHAGLLLSQRGADGGYWLARPAAEIALADIIRAVDGPLANIRGRRPETIGYEGAAIRLSEVWLAVRASLRAVLEHVTLADLVEGPLPPEILDLAQEPEARRPH
ncbi:MAG TPA: Rrf2 family transcriptional regulator [Acidimicrobiales bacterium]|jgi:Rrf2 family protein|nr:Rrf2 family transcriptional regulator [Acidimicrobiales bacterium]